MKREHSCVYCGCTDSRACVPACSWMVKHRATNTGVCSSQPCVDQLVVDADLAVISHPPRPSKTPTRPTRPTKRTQSQLP